MKTAQNSLRRLRTALSADPVPWAAWLLIGRVCSKIKSRYLAQIFNAPGLYLGPRCVVKGSRFIHIGEDLYVHGNLWLEAISSYGDQRFTPRIEIGDRVGISQSVHISCIHRITIGDGALIGSHVYISDHGHGSYKGPVQSHPNEPPSHRQLGGGGTVDIGQDVLIGDNVVIFGPVSIGCGSVIGANAVVRSSVPEFSMAVGVPAKVVKHFDPSAGSWEKP